MPQRPLRIGIDARLVVKRRGIGNIVHHLLHELARSSSPHTYFAYVDSQDSVSFIPKAANIIATVLAPSSFPLWEQFALPVAAQKDQLDVLHCVANTGPVRNLGQTKLIVTVNDVMFLMPESKIGTTPTLYHKAGRSYRRFVVPRITRKADRVLTISECSKRDVHAYIDVPNERVRSIYISYNEGVQEMSKSEAEPILDRLGVREPFFFALGALEPRKNTRRIIEAFANFKNNRSEHVQLVVSGIEGTAREAALQWVKEAGVEQSTSILGFVSEEEISALYSRAMMFVWPSLYEGFGLPLLEAMAVNTPVITAPNGSIPEVVGEAALMCDAESIEDISSKMAQLYRDDELRQTLIERGKHQVQKFNWQKMTQSYIEEYESVCG